MSRLPGFPPRNEGSDEAELAPFFSALQAAPAPELPPDFEARLMATALALQPAPPRRAMPRPGLVARLSEFFAGFGGMPGLAGMTAAGVAGIWIGLAETGPASALTRALWQDSTETQTTTDTAAGLGLDWTVSDAATPFDSPLPVTD